jgi:hypothetical protein
MPAMRSDMVVSWSGSSVQLSGQELSPTESEGPIFIIVLRHRNDEIGRVETAVAFQPLGQQRVSFSFCARVRLRLTM